ERGRRLLIETVFEVEEGDVIPDCCDQVMPRCTILFHRRERLGVGVRGLSVATQFIVEESEIVHGPRVVSVTASEDALVVSADGEQHLFGLGVPSLSLVKAAEALGKS